MQRIILGLILILSFKAYSQVVIDQSHTDIRVDRTDYSYLIDSSNTLSAEQVFKSKSVFLPNQSKWVIADGISTWYTFDLINESTSESFVLEFLDPHIRQLELYVIERDTIVDFHFNPEGYYLDFDKKVLQHKNHSFDLNLRKGVVYSVFVKLKTSTRSSLSTRVRSTNRFVNYALGEYFYLGMFYGVLFIMIVYHLFVYTSTDEKSYLFFIFYLTAGALVTFYEDGLGFQFVWPHLPTINVFMPYVFRLFLPLAFYLYYSRLIELRLNFPKLQKALLTLVILVIICELAFSITGLVSRFYFVSLIVIFTITLFSSLYLILNLNYRPAYYLLAANSILLFNFMLMLLRSFKVIPSTVFTVYSFNFSFVLEAVIFALALGEKMRLTKENEIYHLKEAKKSNDQINRELKELVKEKTNEAFLQKNAIEQQKEDLIEGLTYAKRVQESILPNPALIKNHFADFGVLNIPKDVVSGDFYWFHEINSEQVIFAVGDSEGARVSGSFISVLANSELNSIVRDQHVHAPSQILSLINKKVFEILHENGPNTSNNESLSLAVCLINKSYQQMEIASANRDLYFVRNEKLEVIHGARNVLGSEESQKAVYETQYKSFVHNELMYISSDGLAKQVGGLENQVYGSDRLKDKLKSLSKLSLGIQTEILSSEFQNWRGTNDQIDDVLLVGIRF